MRGRKSMRDLEFQIHETYADLDPSWNQIPTECFLHPSRVALAEISHIDDLEYRYVTVIYKKSVVAHLYFQVLRVKNKHLNLQSPIWRLLTNLSMRIFHPKLLICGHLFRHDVRTVRFLDSSLSDFLQAKIIYQACTKLLKKCGNTALLIKDLPQGYNHFFLNHAPNCKAMKEDISMEMAIAPSWDSFDHYLDSLKHKYKQRSKKIRAKSESLDTRRLNLQEVEKYADQLEYYYTSLLEKQMVKLGIINLDYLKKLMQEEEDFRIYGIFENGTDLIGFYSCFIKEDLVDMYFVGYHPEKNRDYNLYFNILFWGLELAITQEKSKINMGRTALDPKASIGCEPAYTQNFYRIKNRLFNAISRRGQDRFLAAQGEVWEIRRPFNNEYYQTLNKPQVA